MKIKQLIQNKLLQEFAPEYLTVDNESDMHSGPLGRETHFRVVIVSEKFRGQPLVARQRRINQVLADELKAGVHALAQRTLTPEEWEKAGRIDTSTSPNCAHAAKK